MNKIVLWISSIRENEELSLLVMQYGKNLQFKDYIKFVEINDILLLRNMYISQQNYKKKRTQKKQKLKKHEAWGCVYGAFKTQNDNKVWVISFT